MTSAKNGNSLLSAVCFRLPQRMPLLFCPQKSGTASLPRNMKLGNGGVGGYFWVQKMEISGRWGVSCEIPSMEWGMDIFWNY